eukprot:scaffold6706_cov17-Tisochrysis_lutea.AAC.1
MLCSCCRVSAHWMALVRSLGVHTPSSDSSPALFWIQVSCCCERWARWFSTAAARLALPLLGWQWAHGSAASLAAVPEAAQAAGPKLQVPIGTLAGGAGINLGKRMGFSWREARFTALEGIPAMGANSQILIDGREWQRRPRFSRLFTSGSS